MAYNPPAFKNEITLQLSRNESSCPIKDLPGELADQASFVSRYPDHRAVQQAIENGELEARRLTSYQKLKREDAHNTQTIAERHARTRRWNKSVRRHNAVTDKRNPT